jgi:hypothetical protein
MAKKLSIIIIIWIFIITVMVLAFLYDKKFTSDTASTIPVVVQQQQNISNNTAADVTVSGNKNVVADNDTKTIEDDLNSVSDDNFSENNLSDSQMGL